MSLSILKVCAVLQRGLLDTITPNIRLITTSLTESSIDIFFYYDKPPSEEEVELSEEISTEVMCAFQEMPSIHMHRIVLPEPKKLPQDEDKIPVYARFEKPPPKMQQKPGER